MLKKMSLIYRKIGLDGVVFVVSVITVIFIAIYSLVSSQAINPTLLVTILSLLALEIVVQRIRLDESKNEIINSLKGVRVQTLSGGKDFSDMKYKLLLNSEHHIYDTELCVPKSYFRQSMVSSNNDSKYRKELYERIKKGQLTFKKVQIIYEKSHFESLLKRMFELSGYRYYLGYFIGAPEVIPVLNLMIFDDRYYLIGGYYGPSARGEDKNLYIEHEEIGDGLQQYFTYLWSKARLFNDGRVINWDEIRHCGIQLGYSIADLNLVVKRIADEVGYKEIQTLKE